MSGCLEIRKSTYTNDYGHELMIVCWSSQRLKCSFVCWLRSRDASKYRCLLDTMMLGTQWELILILVMAGCYSGRLEDVHLSFKM